MPLLREMRFAVRGFARAPGFTAAVVITLGLGIGANAAIFSVLRGVLMRPLPNRDEDRLVYIRQSAPGVGAENAYFSVQEIADYRARLRTFEGLGEFSTMTFTAVGLKDPRQVRAGLVDGGYFRVMGLRPVLGRLLGPSDDGPSAAGAAVLTHRFWTEALGADRGVIGRTIRLGTRSAVVVGVVEPSLPYPTETELFANIVTSPHHMSAEMTGDRRHRMTEVFGRLAPGADLPAARTELSAVLAALEAQYPEAYEARSDFRVDAVRLRDQIVSGARPVLLLLLAAAVLVYVIACSNVANLVLARAVRRREELALRGALGASGARLRKMLLVECLLLSAGGALAGVLLAGPSVRVLALYAARFTVRAQELRVDATLLWVSVASSLVAALLFAWIPRLPTPESARSGALSQRPGSVTPAARRGQRAFAVAQIAASYLLLAGAGVLIRTLLTLQSTAPGFETENVLAVNVPVSSYGRTDAEIRGFYDEVRRRVSALPGVREVSVGSAVPWRDARGLFSSEFAFRPEGWAGSDGGKDPRANFRAVSPAYFATLGIPLVAGRDFNEADRAESERVVIVSEGLARTLLGGRSPVGRHLRWTDERMRFIDVSTEPRRIVGVAADVRDTGIEAPPRMTVYHPFSQEAGGGRLFVHASGDPYALVPAITRVVRDLAADQPVERAATLADIRTEVLAPSRLNAFVVGGFALLALAIAVVGVAGMLGFWVSGRTREIGIRLAIGSRPRDILAGVLREGAAIAAAGIGLGLAVGGLLRRIALALVPQLGASDVVTLLLSAAVLGGAAVASSAIPAMRAARVQVIEALRAE